MKRLAVLANRRWYPLFMESGYRLWLAKTAKTFHGCFSVIILLK